MNWTTKIKTILASIILRHRVLNRFAHKYLPKKRMAAGVLLFDDAGRLLLVKPSYRPDWLIPGGVVERNEPPWLAARRETGEEIGLTVDRLRFIGMDWRSSDGDYDDSLHFLFDGGTLSDAQQASIRCDGVEIVAHQFATRDQAETLLEPHLMRRILSCWQDGLERPLIMNRGVPDQGTV